MIAKCIKDGFMDEGRQFCIKDQLYKYKIFSSNSISSYNNGKKFDYHVQSERHETCSHSMRKEFFNRYFMEMENCEFLSKEEMVI